MNKTAGEEPKKLVLMLVAWAINLSLRLCCLCSTVYNLVFLSQIAGKLLVVLCVLKCWMVVLWYSNILVVSCITWLLCYKIWMFSLLCVCLLEQTTVQINTALHHLSIFQWFLGTSNESILWILAFWGRKYYMELCSFYDIQTVFQKIWLAEI